MDALQAPTPPAPRVTGDVAVFRRRYERERAARLEAEAVAERGLRELHRRERHVALLEVVARAANSSSSSDEVLLVALTEICDHTGWACGFVFKAEGDGKLVAGQVDFVSGEGLGDFVLSSGRCDPEAELAGAVKRSRVAAWVSDIGDRPSPRQAVATLCGLRTTVAFPVIVQGEVAAVVEFFSRDAQGADTEFLGVLDAIGVQLARVLERERHHARLLRDARHDALTGLPNRAYLLEKLGSRISLDARADHAEYAVLFVDLDRFKLLNDSLGHRAGDALLIETGNRFSVVLEACGYPTTLARLGGDEFVALVDGVEDLDAAACVARRLLDSLKQPFLVEGHPFHGSASIGVTVGSFGYDSAEAALRDADLAMYEAKRAGKARVGLFEPRLHLQAVRRLAVEADLRQALRDDRFAVHYQPIVALSGRRPPSFEALVRWSKEDDVLVAPAEFLSVAEDTGLIVFIGEVVMRKACLAAVDWNRHFPHGGVVSVGVNASARQLQQPDFVEVVKRVLEATGATPAMLRIELTESVAVSNFETISAVLRELREIGVRTSIDDFGTGHSSLAYLHQLAFDAIKIDRSFVQSMGTASDRAGIVETVIDLSRKLRVDAVAEGAETAVQVRTLRRLGCGFVQGYHIARPMALPAATLWLAQYLNAYDEKSKAG